MSENLHFQALNIKKDLKTLLILIICIGLFFGLILVLEEKTGIIETIIAKLHLATLGNS
ncbi:MAG: hypothetical protein WCT08_06630 [Patescibacteria group bacterium]|jgi:hypothetical protein